MLLSLLRRTRLYSQSFKLGQQSSLPASAATPAMTTVNKTEEEWRAILSPQQVRLSRNLRYDV